MTDRPDERLFYSRSDPRDPRLGEVTAREKAEYGAADIVLLGVPQDIGVKRNRGRPGARKAPAAIRGMLYRFPVPDRKEPPALLDAGDLKIQETLEDTLQLLKEAAGILLNDGKRLIILGGGNDISYADAAALADHQSGGRAVFFNIDSHYDLRADDAMNSGTPYRRLIEDGYVQPECLYEMAVKPIANSPVYDAYVEKEGVNVYTLDHLQKTGVETVFRTVLVEEDAADAVFWGMDMDAVRSTDAPGVSASYPTGLSAEEFLAIARLAGDDPRSMILEISEVNPDFDVDGRTSRLAAMAILSFLGAG